MLNGRHGSVLFGVGEAGLEKSFSNWNHWAGWLILNGVFAF